MLTLTPRPIIVYINNTRKEIHSWSLCESYS